MAAEEPKGIIGKSVEDGLPVVWSLVNELPPASDRDALPWLTVISWRYDGTERNGMPMPDVNERMLKLEDALEALEAPHECALAYRRTGNNMKEFVYYINEQAHFMAKLNSALKSHDRYPIEIHFYEDKEWKDFRRILGNFSGA